MYLVETTSINSILTVRNPSDNVAALTITPLAGGTQPFLHILLLNKFNDKNKPLFYNRGYLFI